MIARLIRQLRWYLRQLVQQFLDYDCLTSAGALTYTTLFAIVPMMTVAYTMFSLFPEFSDVGQKVQDYIFSNFVPTNSDLVQEKLFEFSERARNLTAVGLLFLFVTSLMMLVRIEKVLNTIWHVTEPRQGLQRFLLYWAVLSLGPLLIVVGVFVSIYLAGLPFVSDLETFGLGKLLLGYVPFLANVAAFTVLYYAVPNCPVLFRHALLGGLMTTLALELAKWVFATIIAKTNFEPVYGTFAAVPLFLFWLYTLWVVVLTGAILVRSLSLAQEDLASKIEPPLLKCAQVLQLLYDAHMQGDAVSDQEINDQIPMARTEHEQVFAALAQLKVLNQTEDERWVLGRNLKSLTLWDLYQQLPEGLDVQSLEQSALTQDMGHVIDPIKALVEFGSNQMAVSLDSVFGAAK